MLRLDTPVDADPLAGAVALRPEMYAGMEALAAAAYGNTQLEIRVIEGARMRIAQLNGCVFCQGYRTARDHPGFRDAEAPSESFFEAVADWRTSDEFSPRERMAIEFADRYVSDHLSLDTDDELWQQLHAEFSDAELVDLTLFVGASMVGGRFMHIFGLDAAACAAIGR